MHVSSRRQLSHTGRLKKALEEIATIVKPETILAWHRTLVAQKFDGSQKGQTPSRPRIDEELEAWVVRLAADAFGTAVKTLLGRVS
jgi:hypothetical protein